MGELMIDAEDRGDDVEGEEEEGGETRTTRKVSPTLCLLTRLKK